MRNENHSLLLDIEDDAKYQIVKHQQMKDISDRIKNICGLEPYHLVHMWGNNTKYYVCCGSYTYYLQCKQIAGEYVIVINDGGKRTQRDLQKIGWFIKHRNGEIQTIIVPPLSIVNGVIAQLKAENE